MMRPSKCSKQHGRGFLATWESRWKSLSWHRFAATGRRPRSDGTSRTNWPQFAAGYGGQALALRELGRLDEAETILDEGMRCFPSDRGLIIEHVEIARRRSNWVEVLSRLTAARARFPSDPDIHRRMLEATLLVEEGAFAAAHAATREAGQPRYLLFVATEVGIGHLFSAIVQSAYYGIAPAGHSFWTCGSRCILLPTTCCVLREFRVRVPAGVSR